MEHVHNLCVFVVQLHTDTRLEGTQMNDGLSILTIFVVITHIFPFFQFFEHLQDRHGPRFLLAKLIPGFIYDSWIGN